MNKELNLEDFKPYVGQPIKVKVDDIDFEMELTEAELSKHSQEGTRKSFNLLFRSPEEYTCNQGTYTLHMDHIDDPISVFMTPIESQDPGSYLEAVFN